MTTITIGSNSFDVLDVFVVESNVVAISDWINTDIELQTNIWRKSPFEISYLIRMTSAEKWVLDQLLFGVVSTTLTDTIYSIVAESYVINSISAKWEGHINSTKPWALEITLIKG